MIICIVCREPLNHENPGRVIGLVQAHVSDIEFEDYEKAPVSAYHSVCEEEGLKIIHHEDMQRLKRMGIVG